MRKLYEQRPVLVSCAAAAGLVGAMAVAGCDGYRGVTPGPTTNPHPYNSAAGRHNASLLAGESSCTRTLTRDSSGDYVIKATLTPAGLQDPAIDYTLNSTEETVSGVTPGLTVTVDKSKVGKYPTVDVTASVPNGHGEMTSIACHPAASTSGTVAVGPTVTFDLAALVRGH